MQARRAFGDGQRWAPLVSQNVQADAAVGVDVGVVDARGEVDLGRLERVVGREVDGEEEDAARVRRVALQWRRQPRRVAEQQSFSARRLTGPMMVACQWNCSRRSRQLAMSDAPAANDGLGRSGAARTYEIIADGACRAGRGWVTRSGCQRTRHTHTQTHGEAAARAERREEAELTRRSAGEQNGDRRTGRDR